MSQSRLSEIRNIRLDRLKKLRDLGIDPYPSKPSQDFISTGGARRLEGESVFVVGRLRSFREHGNVIFADLRDASGQIQLLFQKKTLEDKFKVLKLIDSGDFLGAGGTVTTTQSGEITVDVSHFELLGKSLRPLPDELSDTEERYRKRYLDLLLDPSVRTRFDAKTKIYKETRNYLDSLGFFEVETPVFHPLYGGANAKPFISHMNALDRDYYLRIAFELYLKRLVVGGYDKVYEIGRDFRNEGIDQTHNPEFTMLEWYEAYADYHRIMDVTEGLFKHLAGALYGTTKINVGDHAIDIGVSWPRIPMQTLIKEKLDLDTDSKTTEELAAYCKKNNIALIGGETKGQIIFQIFDDQIAGTLIQPTFVIDYPADISPLSKPHSDRPDWVQRFEGYIGGKEIVDGWSELTDPEIQRQRFEFDVQAVRKDKEEIQQTDEDFLEAMEYGMPPMGGIGIGMDRITMFFTNTWTFKEILLFPTLRPDNDVTPKQDFDRKLVVVIDPSLPAWQIMNTSAHISAFLGNKMTTKFDTGKYFTTKDGKNLPRNTQYPIVTLSATQSQLAELISEVRKTNLLHIGYVPEMMETTDDKKLVQMLGAKSSDEVTYAGVGIFGLKKEVDLLTKKFTLWGK